MFQDDLWENFKKTGHIADYLRYRGIDIYAAQNSTAKEDPAANAHQNRTDGAAAHHRRPDHPGIQ